MCLIFSGEVRNIGLKTLRICISLFLLSFPCHTNGFLKSDMLSASLVPIYFPLPQTLIVPDTEWHFYSLSQKIFGITKLIYKKRKLLPVLRISSASLLSINIRPASASWSLLCVVRGERGYEQGGPWSLSFHACWSVPEHMSLVTAPGPLPARVLRGCCSREAQAHLLGSLSRPAPQTRPAGTRVPLAPSAHGSPPTLSFSTSSQLKPGMHLGKG